MDVLPCHPWKIEETETETLEALISSSVYILPLGLPRGNEFIVFVMQKSIREEDNSLKTRSLRGCIMNFRAHAIFFQKDCARQKYNCVTDLQLFGLASHEGVWENQSLGIQN